MDHVSWDVPADVVNPKAISQDPAFTGAFARTTYGTSATPPTATKIGELYYDQTLKRLWQWDGTGWIILFEQPITTFVPTITAHAGTLTTVSATMVYARNGGYLDWEAVITITNNGTGATNIHMSLPFDAAVGSTPLGFGRENALTGNMLNVNFAGGLTAWIQKYDNTYPGGTGFILGVGGRYRMASRYS